MAICLGLRWAGSVVVRACPPSGCPRSRSHLPARTLPIAVVPPRLIPQHVADMQPGCSSLGRNSGLWTIQRSVWSQEYLLDFGSDFGLYAVPGSFGLTQGPMPLGFGRDEALRIRSVLTDATVADNGSAVCARYPPGVDQLARAWDRPVQWRWSVPPTARRGSSHREIAADQVSLPYRSNGHRQTSIDPRNGS